MTTSQEQSAKPTGWMIAAGVASCVIGLAALGFAMVLLFTKPTGWAADCKRTSTVERSPGSSLVAKTTLVETCEPPQLAGAVLIPALVGAVLVLPAVRILAKNLDLTVGPFSIKDKSPTTASSAYEAGVEAKRRWDEIPVVVLPADRLRDRVEPLRERPKGAVRRLLNL